MELKLKQIAPLEIIFSFQPLNKWGEGKSKLSWKKIVLVWENTTQDWLNYKGEKQFLDFFQGNGKPDPCQCRVLLMSCPFVSGWHSEVCWETSLRVCLQWGTKQLWQYLEICKIWGQSREAQRRNWIRESLVECVLLDRLKEEACFGFYPFAFETCWVCTQMFMEVHSSARSLCSSWALSLCIVSM